MRAEIVCVRDASVARPGPALNREARSEEASGDRCAAKEIARETVRALATRAAGRGGRSGDAKNGGEILR